MKKLVSKCIVKIAIAIILCVTISILISSFTPHLSNDMALGQLENDDMSWSLMNAWYQIQSYSGWIYGIVIAWCIFSISKECYKFKKGE